jgi:hypothetical protein
MTDTTDMIEKIFSDKKFDLIIIAGTAIDRESFISTRSVTNGENERVEIVTTDMTMYYDKNSSETRIVQTKEVNRAFFDELYDDKNIHSILVNLKSESHEKVIEIILDDCISKKKNKFNTTGYIIETKTDIHNIDFSLVSFIQGKKKVV